WIKPIVHRHKEKLFALEDVEFCFLRLKNGEHPDDKPAICVKFQKSVEADDLKPPGIAPVQGVKLWFERWEKRVGGREAILKWDLLTRRQLLEEMRPLLDLAKAVAATLRAS
ncbi:MAG: hypothetical protein ACOYMV_00990, partial [Verrucomicrobiia bacterium]